MSMLKLVSCTKDAATFELRLRSVEFARLWWRAVANELRAAGLLASPRAWLMCLASYIKIVFG
jgi:hypothetical protein